MKKLRGLFRIIFGRTAFVILFMAIQLGILFGVFRWLEDYVHIIYVVSILLSAVVIIYIFNEPINSSFKMAWISGVMGFGAVTESLSNLDFYIPHPVLDIFNPQVVGSMVPFLPIIIFVIPFASLKAQTSYEKMLYLSTI